MVDYYSILLRAVTTPGAGDAEWRRGIYERARQMLADRLRKMRPPAPMAQIAAEEAALEAAIDRIETEMAWTEGGADGAAGDAGDGTADMTDMTAAAAWAGPRRSLLAVGPGPFIWILLAVIVAAFGAGGYVIWTSHRSDAARTRIEAAKAAAARSAATSTAKIEAAKTEATKTEATKPEARPAPSQSARPSNAAKDGELAAGIDGGASDPDLPYVFRRQPTFYRTLQPAGTIIVDKLQHFLYLIQPNSVAIRYGIALGDQCKDLVGLKHVASKAEWPPWEATPDMIKRRLASAGTLPGGPGNPLGARLLTLDDGRSRIHGTNAPKTIGGNPEFGCIRLANDDIVDLYNRVKVDTPVVMN